MQHRVYMKRIKDPILTESKRKLETAALTIAGSDSCGGAGIQADLATFKAHGTYAATVITALTAQNTLAVHAVQSATTDIIVAQLNAVLDDLPIRAIKTGMLPDAAAIEAVAETLQSRAANIPLVVDPVLVATSGAALTVEDTVTALRTRLIPIATLVTPNLVEARALSPDASDPLDAGRELLSLGCQAVLLKGGHGQASTITDRLLDEAGTHTFEHRAREGEYHGTGCVLSAAITANLAQGDSLEDAVKKGIGFVQKSIASARLPLAGALHLIT